MTGLKLKSIITQPLPEETLPAGPVVILGSAYAGEGRVQGVDVSVDGGQTWHAAECLGPDEPYAWRQWQYVWQAEGPGRQTIMARATATDGALQPLAAEMNKLGYGNNGVREHAVSVVIV